MKISNKIKYELWDVVARIVAVIPPLVATMYFFPEWVKKSAGATWSGTIIIVMLFLMIPMWKKIFAWGKEFALTSASMPVFWLIITGFCYLMQYIADKVFCIGIAGLVGSLMSAGICILRNKYREDKAEEKTDNNTATKEGGKV